MKHLLILFFVALNFASQSQLIRYRQPIKYGTGHGVFQYWHYWGLLDSVDRQAFTPPSNNGIGTKSISDQSTGFIDGASKEVYRGDIFNDKKKGNGIVEYIISNSGDGWVIIFKGSTVKLFTYLNVKTKRYVIGNVEENPELF